MGKWQTVPLADLCDNIQYGVTASASSDLGIGPRLLRITDIVPPHIDWSAVPRCALTLDKFKKFELQDGDIVVARTGATVGYAKQIREPPEQAVFASYLVRFQVSGQADSRFVGQVVQSSAFKQYVATHAGGAAQPNANAKLLGSYPVPFPEIALQRRIAAVLSAFDELIEINKQRVQLLEDLARSLYREWFVHFRFPGYEDVEFVDSELGPIPDDWVVRPLHEMCAVLQSGATPRRSDPSNWEGGAMPWFKTGELRDGPLFDSAEHVTVAASARIFEPPTILMAIYGSPTVGRLGWVTRPSSCNQAALALRAHNPDMEQDWLWYTLENLRDPFNSMAQGAAQQNISKQKVAETAVSVPDIDLLRMFAERSRPLRDLWEKLASLNHQLTAVRDLLLPRLVSGKLDISDIDLGVLTPAETE